MSSSNFPSAVPNPGHPSQRPNTGVTHTFGAVFGGAPPSFTTLAQQHQPTMSQPLQFNYVAAAQQIPPFLSAARPTPGPPFQAAVPAPPIPHAAIAAVAAPHIMTATAAPIPVPPTAPALEPVSATPVTEPESSITTPTAGDMPSLTGPEMEKDKPVRKRPAAKTVLKRIPKRAIATTTTSPTTTSEPLESETEKVEEPDPTTKKEKAPKEKKQKTKPVKAKKTRKPISNLEVWSKYVNFSRLWSRPMAMK